MPRITRSNYQAAFRAMNTADPGIPGPKFSDDIQLTAQIEDFRPYTRTYLAAGGFRGGLAGVHGCVDVHILSPGGAIFYVVDEVQQTSAGQLSSCAYEDDEIVFELPAALDGNWGFIAGPAPLSTWKRGYTSIGQSTGALFRSDRPFLQGSPGVYLSFGRHLRFICANPNKSILYSWVMAELHRTDVAADQLVNYG